MAIRLQLIMSGDYGPIIHRGKIVRQPSETDAASPSVFEFVAESGMRVPLDTKSWRRVRTISKVPLSTIYIATKFSPEREFVLQPVAPSEKETGEVNAAEEQLRTWQAEGTEVLVSVGIGPFQIHYAATLVVSEAGQFGYDALQSNLFCTATPYECDHAEVLDVGTYRCVRMRDDKTGSTFIVTNRGGSGEHVGREFPLGQQDGSLVSKVAHIDRFRHLRFRLSRGQKISKTWP